MPRSDSVGGPAPLGPVVPRYEEAGVASLLPDALAALAGAPRSVLPLGDGLRGIVVLVVDGLGRHLLQASAGTAPFLTAACGPTLDAPFPSTTSTSLTSIGTGTHPGVHGIVGYTLAVPSAGRSLVTLTWSWDRHDPSADARDEAVPEDVQPNATVFEQAGRAGIGAVTVLRPEFVGSGLTRAALRGGRVVTATGLSATLAAAVDAAARPPDRRKTLVYAHHGTLDTIGHLRGPSSEAWCRELAAVDTAIERITATLPDHVALVVTADHGMVEIDDADLVELADDPDLLAGVRLLSGDLRMRHLHTRAGATDEILAVWRERFGSQAHVTTRDGSIEAGWFGPRVTAAVRDRVGDVVVSAAVPEIAWVHRERDLFGGRVPGMHGAMTPDEIAVPALVFGG